MVRNRTLVSGRFFLICRVLQTRQAGHADVHQHHVGAHFVCLVHGIAAVRRLADHFKVALALQQAANALPEQRMIID